MCSKLPPITGVDSSLSPFFVLHETLKNPSSVCGGGRRNMNQLFFYPGGGSLNPSGKLALFTPHKLQSSSQLFRSRLNQYAVYIPYIYISIQVRFEGTVIRDWVSWKLNWKYKSRDKSQVEPGKYSRTSNCRENKYFHAIAGNIPSFCMEYYQACPFFYHSGYSCKNHTRW